MIRGYGALPIKEYMANPEGTKAREPYQNFDGEGLPSESTTSPPYREGLGEGGCFFYFFSSRRRKGESPSSAYEEIGLISNRFIARVAATASVATGIGTTIAGIATAINGRG